MVDFSDKQLEVEDMLPENWRTSMNHSDELYHFGIKGMKWGVRKKRDKPSKAQLNKPNADYTSRQRITDRASYGKKGVKRINRRMNKGHSAPYMNYLRARYGAGYSWASPANEALKAIGNKIIVNTVISR